MFGTINRLASGSVKNVLSSRCKSKQFLSTTSTTFCNHPIHVPIIRDEKPSDELKKNSNYFYHLTSRFFKHGEDYNAFKQDMMFAMCYKTTLQTLENQSSNEVRTEIVDKLSILRSLQVIGMPPEDQLICKLIESLSLDLHQLRVDKVIKVLLNQVQFQSSKLQKFFLQNLVKQIESNIEDINNLDVALMIYNETIVNLFSIDFMQKIDQKTIEIVKRNSDKPLTESEITWILHQLSSSKRRPKPLINYLVNSLNQMEIQDLQLNKVTTLVESLANLNYLSVDLMDKITQYLIDIDFRMNISNFDFVSLLKSLIKLRYDPEKLFDNLTEDLDLLTERMNKKSLMNLVSTMAFFNYPNSKATRLLSSNVLQAIDIDLVKDAVLRIEYLWALAFYDNLNRAPVDQFALDFFTKVLNKKHFYYLMPRFALLYHYCRLNLGLDYTLPNDFLFRNQQILSKTKSSLTTKTSDLIMILKKEDCLHDVETELGFKFDLVFVCNKDFKTLPIRNLDEAKKLCNDEYKLIYVYFADLKEFSLNSSKILGELEMMQTLGKQLDYRIVLLNLHDIMKKPSLDSIKQFKQTCINLI